jgi:hypothetical protein
MNKKIIVVLNTQLSLLITWCLLEVDAKNLRKSQKFEREKKTWKLWEFGNCAWIKMKKNVLEKHEKKF